MKRLAFFIFIAFATWNLFTVNSSFAIGHEAHPQHNMVLFGDEKIYASHIVYKEPHNYQIILKLDLDARVHVKIREEFITYSNDLFLFRLDHMDISQIHAKPIISGTVLRKTSDGETIPVIENLQLESEKYSIIFINEIPLDLSSKN